MKMDKESQRLANKAVLAIIIALLAGVLAGCGGGGSNSSGTGPGGGGSNTGGAAPLPAGTELFYLGDNAGRIHGFGLDPASGNLTPIEVNNMPTVAAVGLAADSGGMVLYSSNAAINAQNVSSWIVNKHTGTLTASGSVALPIYAHRIAAVERNLYVISDPIKNNSTLFALSIDAVTAALKQLSPAVTLPGVPNDLAIAPSGSWLGLTSGTSGGEIEGILRTPNGGTTGLQLVSPVSTGGDNPQGIRVTPDGKFVVVVNQGSNNLSVFSLDATSGALTPVPGSPFPSGPQPGPMAIDPSGKFVLVADSGNNELTPYTIDSAGSLTAGTPVPLGAKNIQTAMAVDPAGQFAFVGVFNQKVAGFHLDPGTGSLTPMSGSPFAGGFVTTDMVFVPGVTH